MKFFSGNFKETFIYYIIRPVCTYSYNAKEKIELDKTRRRRVLIIALDFSKLNDLSELENFTFFLLVINLSCSTVTVNQIKAFWVSWNN